MSRQTGLYQWTEHVTTAFPNLSKPQATVLALWSFGMVLARSAALSAVALWLSRLRNCSPTAMRARLREWYLEAPAKSGAKRGIPRQELEVATCFAPLLRWILQGWPNLQLALALDATTLGTRFVVLAISVVYRGSAIAVAWKVLPATAKGSWKEPWLELLQQFQQVVPAEYTVIVMSDRGLWAQWLFQGIRQLGWHPLMRINATGSFRPEGWTHFVKLSSLTPAVGSRWRGRGTAFSTAGCSVACTLLAFWGEGHKEAWVVLSDLAPESSDACWYGLRAWIEQGFKQSKRGGWQWQNTRMTDPARAERLWLALAVATLWLVRVGGEVDAEILEGTIPELAAETLGPRGTRRQKPWRLVSVFRQGWVSILVALLTHRRLPVGRWIPEPWPAVPLLPNSEKGSHMSNPCNQETYP